MFETMLAAPFAVFGEAATYTAPASGSPAVALRVIRREAPRDVALGFSGAALPAATMADVRVSDLAQPVEGAALAIGAASYRVRSFDRDSERLVWRLDLEPVP